MMYYKNLIVEIRDQVLWVKINRPKVRNALSLATLGELGRACTEYAAEPALKAVVLTGEGNESFAAGGDLKEFSAIRTAAQTEQLFDLASSVLDKIRKFPTPVVAAVNGWALGGGAELALACDFRVAAAHASIGYIHGRLNITCGFGGGADLMQLLGGSRAMLHGLTAKPLPALEAQRAGLFDRVAEEGERLESCVAGFLEPLLGQQPQVIRAYKAMASAAQQGLSGEERRAIEREWFVRTWTHADHWAAVDATMKK
ncbi:enoyl-CoA hydratase [Steroidobacter denitrificans]|uniref:Ethylmalonyl-CoA decarboxylase n=1 Tax=Steroidobacter denitrificans TaxID=465721 RepID=A0A127FBT4_STEDE|nr:enoyl-CoA hydratase/isomerase family protein [Steroidobacter denitrificans]AMN47065.1 enoyl-CoA hydratase [Steroidobacter denitrificans]